MDNKNETNIGQGAINAAAATQGRPMAGQAEPVTEVHRGTVRTALRLAEQAVDEINTRLREAETERNSHARSVGDLQQKVDRLTAEREYRTKHVRELMDLPGIGRPQF